MIFKFTGWPPRPALLSVLKVKGKFDKKGHTKYDDRRERFFHLPDRQPLSEEEAFECDMPGDLENGLDEPFDDTEVPLIDLVRENDTPPTPPSPAVTQFDPEVEEDCASQDSDRTLFMNDFHDDVEEELPSEFVPFIGNFRRSNATFFG